MSPSFGTDTFDLVESEVMIAVIATGWESVHGLKSQARFPSCGTKENFRHRHGLERHSG